LAIKKNQWLIRYTPESLAYILVPETFKGYFKQRIRWSIGGLEVFLKNIKWVVKQGSTYQRMLLLDMFLSHIWAWLAVITLCQYVLLTVTTKTFSLPGGILILYISLFFIMFFQGLIQDKGQSMLTVQDIFALPFYSTFYWFTSLITAIISQFNIAFFTNRKVLGKVQIEGDKNDVRNYNSS
jgi:Glycosyltransferases, probably involved in cell wall biogenesis